MNAAAVPDGSAQAAPAASAHPPLAELVPHAGPMCLLERVLEWDESRICCLATVAEPHPLAIDGRLPAAALIEYAAQAMAAHGRLVAPSRQNGARHGERPPQGMLAGVRATELHCRWVEPGPLEIRVERIVGDPANVLYGFSVRGSQRTGSAPEEEAPAESPVLATGRALVALERPR